MRSCYAERAFYYWRHGLYGHVVKICEEGMADKSSNVFLHLYRSLAIGMMGDTEHAISVLSRMQGRADLLLVQKVGKYLILISGADQDPAVIASVKKEITELLGSSNAIAVYYSVMIAWMFGKTELVNRMIGLAPASATQTLRAWMELTAGHPKKALQLFQEGMEGYAKSFDILALYGQAMCYAALGQASDCVQAIAGILLRNDFPELNIEKVRMYMMMQKWDLARSMMEELKPAFFSTLEVNEIVAINALLKGENDHRVGSILDALVDDCVKYERGNWRYLVRIASLLGTLGHQNIQVFDRTIRLATVANESAGKNGFASALLGYHQFLAHNYVAALGTIQKVIECEPNPLALEFQIKLLTNTGRIYEAQDSLDMLRSIGYNSLAVDTMQAKLLRKETNSNESVIKQLLDSMSNHLKHFPREISFTRQWFPLELRHEMYHEFLMNCRLDVLVDALDELTTYNRSTSLAPTGEIATRIDEILKQVQSFAPDFTPFLFFKGLLLKKTGSLDDALYLFHSILVSSGVFRLPRVLFECSEILYTKGETEDALAFLEEAANEDPSMVSTAEFAILKAKVSDDVRNWIPIIIQCLETDKPPFQVYISFIDLCIDNQKYEVAASFMKKASAAISHPSEKALLLVRQSLILASRKNFDRAFANLAELKKHKKYKELAYSTEAEIRYKFLGDTESCLETLKELTEVEPVSKSYELLGKAYDRINEFNTAIDVYKKGLRKGPITESIVSALVYSCVHAHRFENAVAHFTSSASFLRSTGYGPMHLINVMLRLKRNEEAAECIAKVLRILSPTKRILYADYMILQAVTLANQKKYSEAEHNFLAAINVMENILQTENQNAFINCYKRRVSKALESLGDCYIKLEKKDKALENYEKALRCDERNVSAVCALFDLYKARYDIDRCQKVCLEYLALDPCNESVVLLLTSAETSKFRELIPHLEHVLQYHPHFYRTLVRLVELCARSGKLKLAMQYIRRAECDDPGYYFVIGLYAFYTGAMEAATKWFKKAMLSSRWEVPSKIALIGLLTNPDRKYIWIESTPLAEDSNIAQAEAILKRLRLDKVTKQITEAEIYCSKNTEEAVKKASEMYTDVLSSYPGNVAALVGLARCHVRNKDYEAAQSILNYVFAAKPFHETFSYFEEAYLMRAHIVSKVSNSAPAQQYIYLALDLNMCCKKGWEMSADMHLEKGMYREAAVAFGRSWELCSHQDATVGYNYAYCSMKSEDYETAMAICREMMNLFPECNDIKEKVLVPSFLKILS